MDEKGKEKIGNMYLAQAEGGFYARAESKHIVVWGFW